MNFYRVEGRDHARTQLDKAQDHCNARIADGLDRMPVYKDHGKEEVAYRTFNDIRHGPRNIKRYIDLGIKEYPQYMGNQKDRKDRCNGRVYDIYLESGFYTLPDPCHVAGAVILACIRGHCHSYCEHALHNDILELACSRDRGNRDRIESIERALHDNCSRCRDAVLYCHRDAVMELVLYCGTVKFPVGCGRT